MMNKNYSRSTAAVKVVTNEYISTKNKWLWILSISAIALILIITALSNLLIEAADVYNQHTDQIATQQAEIATLKKQLQEYKADTGKIAQVIQQANPKLSKKEAYALATMEFKYSNHWNFDKSLTVALTKTESGYDCDQVSWNGTSYGCKQINFNVWKKVFNLKSPRDLLDDPEKNMIIGYEILNIYRASAKGDKRRMLELYYGIGSDGFYKTYATKVLNETRNVKEQIS